MPVVVRSKGDVSIVEITGEFTLGQGGISHPLDLQGNPLQDLGATLSDLLDGNRVRVVLDLEKVPFMDSAGLGHLVAWKKRATQHGGDVRLSRPQKRVREVFELTSLTRVFQIFDSEAEAVASFEGRGNP